MKNKRCLSGCLDVKAFTLIELLVVVLIIGILAAVAVPQYQKAVEKAIMAEAVTNVRAIAKAHQLYHMATNDYVADGDFDPLALTLSGVTQVTQGPLRGRWKSAHFIYTPNSSTGGMLAHARRYMHSAEDNELIYAIYISQGDPTRIACSWMEDATPIQKKLCQRLNYIGTL